MAENKGILPSSTFNTLGNNSNKWEAVYAKKIVGPLTGNVTGNVSGSSSSCTGNSATATKATQDSAGQQINTTYIKGLSISGNTITYTKGNGGTGSITVPTGAEAKGYIVESKYNSDGSWYRKWSDGWLEQGLFIKVTNNGYQFTYPKAFTSKVYGIFLGGLTPSQMNVNVCFYDVTLTNAKINFPGNNTQGNYIFIFGK